jgi:hypothetical protein
MDHPERVHRWKEEVMAQSNRVRSLVFGLAALIAVALIVTMGPVGAAPTVTKPLPVTVTNTPLSVTSSASFDGFRDGFAIGEGSNVFEQFDPLYVSLIVVNGVPGDIVDLSFYYQDHDVPRFTLSGSSITLPLSQPIALDAIAVGCGLGSGECDLEVSLLGTAAG